MKYTTGGRKVYSGGGIEPDLRFDGPVEGFNPTRFGRTLLRPRPVRCPMPSSSAPKATRASGHSGPSRRLVKKDFAVDDAMVADFKKFVDRRRTLKIEEDAWTKDLEFIRAMIRYAIDESVFDIATAKQHLITVDPQAKFAISKFPEAEKLLSSRRRPSPSPSNRPQSRHSARIRSVDPLNIGGLFRPCYNRTVLVRLTGVSSRSRRNASRTSRNLRF